MQELKPFPKLDQYPFGPKHLKTKLSALLNYQRLMRKWAKELLEKASASSNPLEFQEQAASLEEDAANAQDMIDATKAKLAELGIIEYKEAV